MHNELTPDEHDALSGRLLTVQARLKSIASNPDFPIAERLQLYREKLALERQLESKPRRRRSRRVSRADGR
jgi:hypothetical protein